MATESQSHWTFNRGIISPLAGARMDLERLRVAASQMTNWMPRVLGPMMLRPGWGYINTTRSNAAAVGIPFVFSSTDVAEIELTAGYLRVLIDDVLVTRPTVTAAVTNGTFTSNVTSWTDNDEAGATSAWLTGGYLSLIGTGANAAIRDQQVTVNEVNVEHALRIVVARGPVTLRVGSTSGEDDYVSETALGTGTHSLAFTPTGNFFIRFLNRRKAASLVDSVAVEAAGVMDLPTPWGADEIELVRFVQSADVIYAACAGIERRKIERRAARSWSVVYYRPENGAFRTPNGSQITLTPSAITGDITLTASKAIFRSTHVGGLFRIASNGQQVTVSLTGEDQWSDPIRVVGVEDQRRFQLAISGTWSATVTLQYSVGAPGSWVDRDDYTANTTPTIDDGLDNEIVYYRIGIKAGDYTSGTAVASLTFGAGSITGVVRITAYSSATSVSAQVLKDLGGTAASADWSEGRWSDYRGWPSAVVLHEGRLWWMGRDKIDGSVSDGYEDFDDEMVGDSGPILRSIGEGPVDSIHWALSLGRMLIGTASNSANVAAVRVESDAILAARSSSFDEPLTPANFNIKNAATRAMFVDPSAMRLMEAAFDVNANDYSTTDLSVLTPELNAIGIRKIVVQRRPDFRVHCIRLDGTVAVLVRDRAENVTCWVEVETDGLVEDAVVLPRVVEDRVYYYVNRTVNGSTVRYREKWAQESECIGGTLNKQADAFAVFTSATATSTITGAGHMEGEEVVVWGNGRDLGVFTVSGGEIDLGDEEVTSAMYGKSYEAIFKSTRRAFADRGGSPMNRAKRIEALGLILQNTHCQGIQYGTDLDNLDDIPLDLARNATTGDEDEDTIFDEVELDMTAINSEWQNDARFYLKAAAPRPAQVLCATVQLQTHG
jgi:hypothetical protein